MLAEDNLTETIKRLHEVLTTDNEFKPASLAERFRVEGYLLVQMCEYTFSLQQQNAQMKEALEFYGKSENWELPSFGRGHSPVVSDRGEKARVTLQSIQGGPSNE